MITKEKISDINLKIVDIIIVILLEFVVIIAYAVIMGYILYPGFKGLPSTPEQLFEYLLNLPSPVMLIFTWAIVLLYFLYSLVIPIGWITVIRRVKLSAIGLSTNGWIKHFFVGIIYGVIFYSAWGFIGVIVKAFLPPPSIIDYTSIYPYSYWASFFTQIMIAPIGESVWFVGLIFHALAKRINLNIASIITALIFVLMHTSHAAESDYGGLVLLGYFFNMYVQIQLYRARESLLTPIGFHAAYNCISFFAIIRHL